MHSMFFENLTNAIAEIASKHVGFESSIEIVGFLNIRTDRGLDKNVLIDETLDKDPQWTSSCSFIENDRKQINYIDPKPVHNQAQTDGNSRVL